MSLTTAAPAPTAPLHERNRWVYEHLPAEIVRLLDVGCHDGATTSALAPRVGLAVGIDVDVPALTEGARSFRSVRFLAASGDALPFGDETFDCVVFSEVLEHVAAEAETTCIGELRRVLQRGGTLILTTPHRGTYWWLDPLMTKTHLRRLRGLLSGRVPQIKGHKHYRVVEIRALLAPHFDVLLVERPGHLLYPLAYWGHLLPFGVGKRPALVRLWQAMMDYDYTVEHGKGAYNICVVARAR
jgi:SAM-dependent methyltransferase